MSQNSASVLLPEPVPNFFLSGNFGPVAQETTTMDLPVRGVIPPNLDGRLLRIGPNPVGNIDPASHHWFSGTGMVHGLRIRGGRAEWYRSRFTVNSRDAKAMRHDSIPGPERGGTAVNTHVTKVAGRVYALVEAGALPIELGDELESIRRSDFGGTLEGGFTAHPKFDPLTGEWVALCYEAGGAEVRYVAVDANGRATTRAVIPLSHGPLIHDVGFTQNFVLVLDLPVHFQPENPLGSNFPYLWDSKHVPRVGLLPRNGDLSKMRWFEAPSCFVFHFINSYESDGKVIADVMRHPRMFAQGHRAADRERPVLMRWTFDLNRGSITETLIDDHGTEFPRIDDRMGGQHYRYCFSAHWGENLGAGPAFKHDLLTGRTEVQDFGGSHRMSLEPIFIPESPSAEEGEGYMMAYVYDAKRDRSDVVIWSAQDFAGRPIATIELPVRVPFGFHGDWIATV
jgi:carotenoid cleavage dioxygenase